MTRVRATQRSVMLAATITVAVATLGATAASAQQNSDRPPHRGGPPPQMLAACEGKTLGDACSATGPRGETVTGTCDAPADRPLACRPQGARPPRERDSQGADIEATRADTSAILCDVQSNSLNESLALQSTYRWTCANGQRSLVGNGIPDHAVGAFPNAGNPNRISGRRVSFAASLMPLKREGAGAWVKEPGYAINGIKFDPGTAGSCPGGMTDRSVCSMGGHGHGHGRGGGGGGGDGGGGDGPWRMEALGQGTFNFGVDANNAHVQPGGEYHYHGIPTGLVPAGALQGQQMALIGWASDGYPMYALYGHANADSAASPLTKMRGSYQLKSQPDAGRPSSDLVPMGGFTQDYRYVAGSGDLDECNGRIGVTPEFPNGIYHYYVTESYPYVQRCVKGTAGRSGRFGPPPGRE